MYAHYCRASDSEISLLRNAEKFLMILPYKNIWQLEKDKSEIKYNELVEKTKQTNALLEKLQKENVMISIGRVCFQGGHVQKRNREC